MNAGTVFSIWAGIVIGLRIIEWFKAWKEDEREKRCGRREKDILADPETYVLRGEDLERFSGLSKLTDGCVCMRKGRMYVYRKDEGFIEIERNRKDKARRIARELWYGTEEGP